MVGCMKPDKKMKKDSHATRESQTESSPFSSFRHVLHMLDNTRDSVWAINASFELLYANKVFKQEFFDQFRIQLESGINMLEVLQGDLRKKWSGYYKRGLNNEAFSFIDEVVLDEQSAFIEVFVYPLVVNDSVTGVSVFGKDITERYESEKALRESEASLLEAQQIAQVGNWELDISSNVLKWSKEIYRIFDTEPGEFNASYKAFIEMVHPDDRDMVNSAYQNSLDSKTAYEIEHRIVTLSQTVKYVREKCRTEYDSNGIPQKSFGIVADITDQKLAEQALKESESRLHLLNAAKDKLFSIIGHDLRSPFNSILGYSNLLLEKKENMVPSESERFLKIIRDSADRTLVLLDNLLNWAKLQKGQLHIEPEKLDLSELIHQILNLKEPLAKAKEISIQYSPADTFELYIMEDIFKTVLRNLVSNAIKFTQKGGNIVVSAMMKKDFVEISVSDNGRGMNKGTLEGLFNLGSNTSTPGTENEIGSGMGLVLCSEFVEKMGGKIWVTSEEGKGSDFRFTVPSKS